MRHPVNVSPVENVSENVQSKTHIMVFGKAMVTNACRKGCDIIRDI